MKQILAFSVIIILSGGMYVTAQDLTISGKVVDSKKQEVALNNQQVSDVILTELNPDSNEIIAYGARKKGIVPPVEIPNAYREDNCVEIPNSYRGDLDKSVEMPNTEGKIMPIPKITPKFLPNPRK